MRICFFCTRELPCKFHYVFEKKEWRSYFSVMPKKCSPCQGTLSFCNQHATTKELMIKFVLLFTALKKCLQKILLNFASFQDSCFQIWKLKRIFWEKKKKALHAYFTLRVMNICQCKLLFMPIDRRFLVGARVDGIQGHYYHQIHPYQILFAYKPLLVQSY